MRRRTILREGDSRAVPAPQAVPDYLVVRVPQAVPDYPAVPAPRAVPAPQAVPALQAAVLRAASLHLPELLPYCFPIL